MARETYSGWLAGRAEDALIAVSRFRRCRSAHKAASAGTAASELHCGKLDLKCSLKAAGSPVCWGGFPAQRIGDTFCSVF